METVPLYLLFEFSVAAAVLLERRDHRSALRRTTVPEHVE
jgi:hypothetical protein